MKKIFSVFIFVCLGFYSFSQSNIIEDIKQSYYDVQKQIVEQKVGNVPENNTKIVTNQMMPAIGAQTIEYEFYFSLKEEKDDISFEHNLLFATRKYNVAASIYSYEEFLFDYSGNLIFYFQSTIEVKCKQLRCYFDDNKLIKVIYKEAELDEDESPDGVEYKVVFESTDRLPENIDKNYINETTKKVLAIFAILD